MGFSRKHYDVVYLDRRYRCYHCGNKLRAVPNSRGYYNIVCPCCGAQTFSYDSADKATEVGLKIGVIFDLDKASTSYLQMSQVPEED